jgi:type VI secretion system secreted protein VgrG
MADRPANARPKVGQTYFELRGDGLPADVQPTAFSVEEALSLPFSLTVDFATRDMDFKVADLLRGGLTVVAIDTERGRARSYSGVCEEARFVHRTGTQHVFRVVVRPPVAALAHREDLRIYQDKGVVDVVKELLAAGGVDKVEWRLEGTYPPREIIIQYRETELDFIHRLLADEGIFYFFLHADGETTMVFADSTNAMTEETEVPVVLALSQGIPGSDPARGVTFTRRARTSSVKLRDYDFEKPQAHPDAGQTADATVPMSYYEYPGLFTKAADGERRASARLRELRRDAEEITLTCGAINLEVGKSFQIAGAAQEAHNGKFVCVELASRGSQSESAGSGDAKLETRVLAQPDGASFSPPRRAKRPRIMGLQTAVVTGPTQGEEEIHCDKYGRIKVRFHWDRVGQFDDKSSCWLRVAQPPLGGQIILPRVGWEVAVAFFDGDPDRPFVVGRVYNAERVPPMALPGSKTFGSLKTSSSPGGAGSNEISLGDSGGGQGFGMTSQKDLNVTVNNDQNETVGGNDSTHISVNASHSVAGSQTVSVGGNQDVSVGSVGSAHVGGALSISVGGNLTDNAISNYVEKVGGSRTESVGGNMTTICNGVRRTIAGDASRTVGSIMLTGSVASIAETIAGNNTENIGVARVDLCKGNVGETIAGNKATKSIAADVHVVKGSYVTDVGGMCTQMVGALHYSKVAGDYSVTAPMITLIGGVGVFKGGGSELKLGGGPVVAKGSAIAIEGALVVKLGTSLKLG